MLYHIIFPLKNYISSLNIFRYITVRAAIATMIALFISLLLGPFLIRLIKEKTNQVLRKLTPEAHKKKSGTPSMGGILIIGAVVLATLICGNFNSPAVSVALFSAISFALLGFIDDYVKDFKQDGKGISSRVKLISQFGIATLVASYIFFQNPSNYYWSLDLKTIIPISAITHPFLYNLHLDLGIFYIPFAATLIVGFSNAINITDGLDGLASGLSLFVFLAFTGIAYLSGHKVLAEYLKIPFIPGIGELSIFTGAFIGASLGFLWYNSHPAQIFMGDTGALALGGTIGTLGLLLKKEILLFFIGGVFIIEILSVVIQVTSYKLRKKRVFKMAPLHHHFELMGVPENKIILRFWIVGALLALLSLTMFKIQ